MVSTTTIDNQQEAMERSELLLKTGSEPLRWERYEDNISVIYIAKHFTSIRRIPSRYVVGVNKDPIEMQSYVYCGIGTKLSDPYKGAYSIHENKVGDTPMTADELIKLAEDDYYGSLEAWIEAEEKFYEGKKITLY